MTRWLLSAHNSRETFGVSYPISSSYIADFMGRRQMEHFLGTMAGGTHHLDRSMPLMPQVNGRLYGNVNYFVRNVSLVMPFDPASIGAPRGLVTSDRKPRLVTLMMLPFRFIRLYRRGMRDYREILPIYRQTLEEVFWQLRECDPEHLTAQDLTLIDRLFEPAMVESVTAYLNALVVIGLPNISVLTWVNEKAPALRNLLVGRGTSTAELGERMWEMRQVAEQCGPETAGLLREGETDLEAYRQVPEAAPLLEAIERFVRIYGHRAFRYASEFEAVRLADQVELVLLTVAGQMGEREPPRVRAEAAKEKGRQALKDMNPIRRYFWKRLLGWGSSLIEGRENNRDTMELQNATYGLAAKLLSRHHFPDQPSDHLWLYRFDEFLDFAQSRGSTRVDDEEIRRRRAELGHNRQLPDPPELIWYDPESLDWWPVDERPQPCNNSLQGIGVSAGSGPVEGVAVVTNNAQEAAERILKLTGPIVLVTHVTDPVWSSLFRRLTAVVTETGGAISHAAIVARESGIPAAVGVPEATQRIHDGQRVRVDGAAGTVTLVGS
jgi:phosphohistidine swiveling domain-containing protein